MIVNHATGEKISAEALRLRFPSVAVVGSPAIGSGGVRSAWVEDDSPTDSEIRPLGYSLVVETEPPAPRAREFISREPLRFDPLLDAWIQDWRVEYFPPPQRVESHKIKIELSSRDLRDAVDSIIDSADQSVKDAFYAPYYHRDSILISQFAQLLGLTDSQVDDIFVSANDIVT